jgi:hypothetical protein
MFSLGPKFDAFIEQTPAAVAVRAVLQRLLPAERLDQLFNDTAEDQYEKKLLFSTIMNLMLHVTQKNSPSLRQAYLAHQHEIPATLSAVYQKVNNLEPHLCAELVRYSARRLRPVLQSIDAEREPLVNGFRTLIVDGNHFSATQHRLVGTREDQAAPLPGFALAVYDPQCEMVVDMIPCDDGHAQERTYLGELAKLVQPNDLWVADRNFCTLDYLFSIHRRHAFFLIRHHGWLKSWEPLGEQQFAGTTDTGDIYEQQIQIKHADGGVMPLRRITVHLYEKTRDGETEIHILTNMSKKALPSIRGSEVYRSRWDVEGMFLELTMSLRCEIDTLAYPNAAIFAFSLAVLSYNAVSLVRGALHCIHGSEFVEQKLSWYHLCVETSSVWRGMEVAIPAKEWGSRIDNLSDREFGSMLLKLCRRLDMSRYPKSRRGPKKKAVKKFDPAVKHVSTAQVLNERNAKKSATKNTKKTP